MLFKAKYLDQFKDGFVKSLSTISHNSALSILIISDAVKHHFYEIDMGVLVNVIQKNLYSSDLIQKLPFNLSFDSEQHSNSNSFLLLKSKFYNYYFTRTPLLIRYTRIKHKGKRRILSAKETKETVEYALRNFSDLFFDIETNLSPDEYSKFSKLSKWYVISKVRDDNLYSIQWLWDAINITCPELLDSNNSSSFANHIIESCFPMYWDTYQYSYGRTMQYYAVSGYFIGDLDMDELEKAFELETK